jgi:hypothetical protein
VAEQVEENKRKEISAVYRHRKEIVVEISGCVIGVVVESGAQRCEDCSWVSGYGRFERK